MISFASVGPSAYWYLTRGTGTIALILLTLSVAFGVANVRRVRTDSMPRFVLDAVHRNVSLLAVSFVIVHIVTAVLDSFAPITLIDAVIPFASAYRPLWLGLGAVAFDLLLAVAITSLLRRRFGYRTWRVTHWAAYASWPVALLHGLGTGSDTKAGWMLAIVVACVVIVIAAVVSRVTAGWPRHVGMRASALGASALLPLGLLVWLPSGPLAKDWARRAGTPASLLGHHSSASASTTSQTHGGSTAASSGFTAPVSGTVQQGSGGGQAAVNISLEVSKQSLSRLALQLQGQPIDGGGLQMTSSSVSLGTASNPSEYRGAVTSLEGTDIQAHVHDGAGHSLVLTIRLQLSEESGAASGTVTAQPG
jgi:sulfoxide reductase heme-binding subunit YedZ